MSVYERGVKLSWTGLIVFLCFFHIMIAGEALGLEPGSAFVVFGVMVLFVAFKNLTLACPKCRKSPFRRGALFWVWPERSCRNCGTDLTMPEN